MAAFTSSSKRLQINKTNSVIVGALAISSFIFVFSLVASRALLSQRAYQSRVLTKKVQARDQLKANLATTQNLMNSYKDFVSTTANVLGGNPAGTADKDGDNAKIVLDALPSKYDFPALTASLEKLLTQNNMKINGITGTDDEVNQAKTQSSNKPAPVEMPFQIDVSGTYAADQTIIGVFESSIRPFYITTLSFSGSNQELQLTMTAKTYYQPQKNLMIRTEVVK